MLNAYWMVEEIRNNVNEVEPKHWTNKELLRKLNFAQRSMWLYLAQQTGDWFLTNKDITASESVIALPSDCAKPVYVEEISTGMPIELTGTVGERRLTRGSGRYGISQRDAYLKGNSIVVNEEDYGEQVTLWYQKKCVDLHMGLTGEESGLNTIQFDEDNAPSLEDDYYNGVTVQLIGNNSIETSVEIEDYDGAKWLATAPGSFNVDTNYGTVSTLPPETIPAIVLKATTMALAKPGAALDPKYFEFFRAEARDAAEQVGDWLAQRSNNSRVRVTSWE